MSQHTVVAVLLAGCVLVRPVRAGWLSWAGWSGRAHWPGGTSWQRLAGYAGGAGGPQRGVAMLCWNAALVALALDVTGWLKRGGWLAVATPLAAGALAAAAPAAARRLVPPALVALGMYGFVIARDYSYESLRTSYGLLAHVGGLSMQYYLVLPQAYALIVAGGWLAWRTADRRSAVARRLLGQLADDPEPRLLWAFLLPLVVAAAAALRTPELWLTAGPGGPAWTAGLILAALAMVRLAPAFAADLSVLGLVLLGLAGVHVYRTWGSAPPGLAVPSTDWDYVLYCLASVASRSMSYVACAQGIGLIAFGAWLAPRTVGVHARELLGLAPDPELARRVQRLTETRSAAVTTAASDLRRLERDLHDGAQARLVALGITLREAERLIPASPRAGAVMVAEARQVAVRALADLRGLVRGIHPPVLADRGLADAVAALALDGPVHVDTDIDLPGRPPEPVESACYFAVAEALANVAKHSGARRAQVLIRHRSGYGSEHGGYGWPRGGHRGSGGYGGPRGGHRGQGWPRGGHDSAMLRIEVSDDGVGGADPAKGTGLAGIEARLDAFDGIMAVSSPPGGPTIVVLEVPCELVAGRPPAGG